MYAVLNSQYDVNTEVDGREKLGGGGLAEGEVVGGTGRGGGYIMYSHFSVVFQIPKAKFNLLRLRQGI